MKTHLTTVHKAIISLACALFLYLPTLGQQVEQKVYMLPAGAIGKAGQFCDGELDDLIRYFDGFSYHEAHVMGVHFKDLPKASSEQMAWLADPSAEPRAFLKDSHWEEKEIVLYPSKTPSLLDANQTAIGDCNCISLFTEMAYLYPDFIKHLIHKESGQCYSVKMFTPQRERIKVKVSSKVLCGKEGNVLQVQGKGGKPTWSTILEKALMKWLQVYRGDSERIGGFGAELMMPIFTGEGRSFSVSPGKVNASQLQRIVLSSLTHGLLVNGGFTRSDVPLDHHVTISAHGHTFMKPSAEGALFAVRNPWGHGDDNHIMQVVDDGIVPPLIDLRIIGPGIAAKYFHPKKIK